MSQRLEATIRRAIFVKVDHTLPTPEHRSIVAAAEAIGELFADQLREIAETARGALFADEHARLEALKAIVRIAEGKAP